MENDVANVGGQRRLDLRAAGNVETFAVPAQVVLHRHHGDEWLRPAGSDLGVRDLLKLQAVHPTLRRAGVPVEEFEDRKDPAAEVRREIRGGQVDERDTCAPLAGVRDRDGHDGTRPGAVVVQAQLANDRTGELLGRHRRRAAAGLISEQI